MMRAVLALVLAGLGVSVRRLHDIDRTGWWVLLEFTIIRRLCIDLLGVPAGHPRPKPVRTGPDAGVESGVTTRCDLISFAPDGAAHRRASELDPFRQVELSQ